MIDKMRSLRPPWVAAFLDDRSALAGHLSGHVLTAQQTATLLGDAACNAVVLRVGRPAQRLSLIVRLVERIELGAASIMIRTSSSRLAATFELEGEPDVSSETIELTCPATKVWHGRQLRLVIPGPDAGAQLGHRDQKLINLIREAHAARRLAIANPDKTISGLARMSGRCRNRLARYLTVSSLAPDIVAAILQGQQPIGFSITQLLEANLPLCWQEQRRLLGFV